jgi:pyruvate dehydrogenase E2 component (dihydrolipoamide acetyltransferase)
MPRLSDTMESGTIIKWNVAEGDTVSAGDVIADVETDKATMELQVFDDGTLAKVLVPEGTTVDVGSVIAVFAEADEDLDAGSASSDDAPAAAQAPEAADAGGRADATPAPVAQPAARTRPVSTGGDRQRVSPVARRVAEEHGIDLELIQGSGPTGRIIKRDVLDAIEAGREMAASVAPAARGAATGGVPATRVSVDDSQALAAAVTLETRAVPLSNMRQTIARRLVESKQTIPHYQVTTSFSMDPLLEMRRALNEQLAPHGIKLSVNDFLVRCCALAMHEHPEFNASWGGDSIHVHGDVNVGIAISIPPERGGGLVVATIRHADSKSLRAISLESKELAEKARTRGLAVEDMSDSTFTLSNLGMFGVSHFTAIINPPNSAILAVGAALAVPVARDGEVVVGHEMSATLSSDHRVIDGAMSARYLQTLKGYIENPATLLV